MVGIISNESSFQSVSVTISYLFVCFEDVLRGDGAYSRAQRFDHSICHLRAHSGRIGVQNTEVALVTLHHQLQRAPLGVHVALCSHLLPPTCVNTAGISTRKVWSVYPIRFSCDIYLRNIMFITEHTAATAGRKGVQLELVKLVSANLACAYKFKTYDDNY